MPRTSLSQLAKVLADRTMSVSSSKQLASEIASYLVQEKRVNELESILREVRVYRDEKGVLDVRVVSAHELTAADVAEVESLIRREFPGIKQVTIDQEIDKNLVGGIKIQTARKQLDMTIRDKIDTFKRLTTRGTI
ncbi:F0F1 ATP synthase subunit delta [Candidatus Saccharibacteria bacterium]|nr:F0F1 ATP synthase subunit delta [Candidatus Saccharibacteria bacterium]